jgi:hypothetical protein
MQSASRGRPRLPLENKLESFAILVIQDYLSKRGFAGTLKALSDESRAVSCGSPRRRGCSRAHLAEMHRDESRVIVVAVVALGRVRGAWYLERVLTVAAVRACAERLCPE